MKFDYVKIVITNEDEYNAKVKVEFSPALPDNEDEIEEQPCLVILNDMLDVLLVDGDSFDAKPEYIQ